MLSVPNMSLNESDTIKNLNETIEKLSAELRSAHLEIENLNSENFRLKMDLGTCHTTIDALKKITLSDRKCTTPRRFRNTTQNKCISTPTRPRDSASALMAPVNNTLLTLKEDENKSIICNKESDTIVSTSPHDCNTTQSNIVHTDLLLVSTTRPKSREEIKNNEPTNNKILPQVTANAVVDITDNVKSKNRVMIFADQAGYGVRQKLQYYLGDSFVVMSMIKPHAKIDEVLKSCASTCVDYTKSDFVLVLVGSNDRNPMLFQTRLHHTLCQLKSTNVLVGKIYRNNFLNPNVLNDLVKLVCDNCDNSLYISLDTNYCDMQLKKVNKVLACRLILRQILQVNYKTNYQNYKIELAYREKQRKIKLLKDVSIQTDDLSLDNNVLTLTQVNNKVISSSQIDEHTGHIQFSDFFRK